MKTRKEMGSESVRSNRLLSLLAVLAIATITLYILIDAIWMIHWPLWSRLVVYGATLIILGAGLFFLLSWFNGITHKREADFASSRQELATAQKRLDAVKRINRISIEASDEREVIELVLKLATQAAGALGASLVPLDEYCQPMEAITYGDQLSPQFDAWIEYLASPTVRERCSSCELEHTTGSCPLLVEPVLETKGLMCYPLRRGEHEFGMLNIHMPTQEPADKETRGFLRVLADETALALEGVRLRRREISALRHLQSIRQKSDLTSLLQGLLENVHQTLEADFALLMIENTGRQRSSQVLSCGDFPEAGRNLLDNVIQKVLSSGESVILGKISGEPHTNPEIQAPEIQAVMLAPLKLQDQNDLGVILVGNYRSRSFHPRHLSLLQTIAGQVTLVVQNANLISELEFKTMLEERTRLAREIHDGLAQTLGFLKLQMAQLQGYFARGEFERLEGGLQIGYQAIAEAYQDAREAIDGLHIDPLDNDFADWLHATARDFEENSGIHVHVTDRALKFEFAPEVQIQLIRVVQEALSNVRKHAGAKSVEIVYWQDRGDFVLEIKDDGAGFLPKDASDFSQHGLRGMRERTELIGADFQVISKPGHGTTIRVRIAVANMEVSG